MFYREEIRRNGLNAFLNKVKLMESLLDEIDRQILACLVEDARMSLKVLSSRVGLTSPSTAERLKRLEERGVIQGYGARVDLAALGYTLQALVRVRPLPGLLHKVDKYIQAMPECIESDKVTGEDCFVIRLVVRSIEHLHVLLAGLAEHAQCNTSIVKKLLILPISEKYGTWCWRGY